MSEKEREYVRDVLVLALGCLAFWPILYGLAALLYRLQWLKVSFNPAPYCSLAVIISVPFILYYPKRFEKHIWGTVCQEQEKLSFPLSFLRNFAIVILGNLSLPRLTDFLANLMMERRYAGDPLQFPDYNIMYWRARETALVYVAVSASVLLLITCTVSIIRQTLRLHRAQEPCDAKPETSDG